MNTGLVTAVVVRAGHPAITDSDAGVEGLFWWGCFFSVEPGPGRVERPSLPRTRTGARSVLRGPPGVVEAFGSVRRGAGHPDRPAGRDQPGEQVAHQPG